MTISQARKFALSELKSSPSPALDADVILKWILKCDQTFILFQSETELSEPQKERQPQQRNRIRPLRAGTCKIRAFTAPYR